MSGERYKAIEGSGHSCCNDWSVIDTHDPVMIGGEHYNGEYHAVCECGVEEEATLIADALNSFSVTKALPADTKTLGK